MRNVAIKLFRAAWAHVATSISIIAISICLVMTMGMYIWNANAQMKEKIHAIYAHAYKQLVKILNKEKQFLLRSSNKSNQLMELTWFRLFD